MRSTASQGGEGKIYNENSFSKTSPSPIPERRGNFIRPLARYEKAPSPIGMRSIASQGDEGGVY